MTAERQERQKECMASRRARVETVLATAEPWETEAELAAKAGVDRATINRYKSCDRTDCNKDLKLTDLYKDDVPYWSQRNVKAVEVALQECSREQLAYLFSEVLPIFHRNLRKGNVK